MAEKMMVVYDRKIRPRIAADPNRKGIYLLKWTKGCTKECSFCHAGGSDNIALPGEQYSFIKAFKKFLRSKDYDQGTVNATSEVDGFIDPVAAELALVIPLFADEKWNPKGHKLLISTRQDKLPYRLEVNCADMTNTIIRVYLTALDMFRMYESGCPSPMKRIDMLTSEEFQTLSARGAEIQVVLGPIAPGRARFWKVVVDKLVEAETTKKIGIEFIELSAKTDLTSMQEFVTNHYKLALDKNVPVITLDSKTKSSLKSKVKKYIEEKGLTLCENP